MNKKTKNGNKQTPSKQERKTKLASQKERMEGKKKNEKKMKE